MKILHTSDWHLGHRLYEQSQYEEQSRFLVWLKTYIDEHGIDVLLVAGDIFDNGAPSAQSQKLYYDFLISLRETDCKHVVIAGGNHDAPGMLNAPKVLLNALSIHVVGKALENIEDEVFKLEVDGEKLIVAAVPYLRDQDIRRAVAGESFDQISERYKQALTNHFRQAANYCDELRQDNTPVIAMGHLFANGGTTSESEQTIYVGGLGDIGSSDFPETFDYIALGHLHRPQMVDSLKHIRYSGSPYLLSFSELGYDKKVVVIEADEGSLTAIHEVKIPAFRELLRIEGELVDCITGLKTIAKKSFELTPWIEVVLDSAGNAAVNHSEIMKVADEHNLQVLKVSLTDDSSRNREGLEKLAENVRNIKELEPLEVFKMKCQEEGFDLNENPEIMDAYHEVLDMVREA